MRGEAVRRARRSLRWTQRRLSQESNVNQDTISRLERGLQSAHGPTIERIGLALGIDPDELVDE